MNSLASLSNKTVLITRAKSQAAEMVKAVRARGGIPIEIPLLHIVPAASRAADCLNLQLYSWIIFTSKNGVRFFFDIIGSQQLPSSLKVAVVGEKTKQALERHGYSAHFTPSSYIADAFVKEFIPLLREDDNVLFPKGNLARDIIPVALNEAGISVNEVIVYETLCNKAAKESLIALLENRKIDILTFASPSTVSNFVTLLEGTNWRQWIKPCTIGCIGPVTEQEATKYFDSLIVPNEYTLDALLDCIAKHYEQA